MKTKRSTIACLIMSVMTAAFAKEAPKPVPYTWPPLPNADALARAAATQTQSGLVLLDKRCELSIESYRTLEPGVRRDDFIRFLIVSDQGVHRASMEVKDSEDAKIESIEARTVAPDGRITTADPKNDIHKSDLSSMKSKDVFASVATVNFPAPAKGAVVDLHVVTYRKGAETFLMEPVGYEETPSLQTVFTIHINGGLPGYQWSVLVAGKDGAKSRIESKGGNTLEVTLDPFFPKKREPVTVPYWHRQTTLICYLNSTQNKTPKKANGSGYRYSYDVDPRGRYSNFTWGDDEVTKWWVEYCKDDQRYCKEFTSSDGQASRVDVKVVAPVSLPLEERVKALYRYVQFAVRYNPDPEDISSLGALLKRGQNAKWQSTLFFAYLLQRAGIPYNICFLTNRYYLQFSPIVTGPGLYGLYTGVTLEIPGKGRIFLTPGELQLPYGCLEDVYQDSLALWLDSDGTMRSAYTPVNPPGTDAVTYRFAAALSSDGSLKGSLWIQEAGSPAAPIKRWVAFRDFRAANPDKDDKTTQQDRAKEQEKRLREECDIPGTKLQRENISVGALPKTSADPIELTCSVQGVGLAQPLQDKWLLYANPIFAGSSNLFTDEERLTPIWYDKGGLFTVTGTIKLPAGSRVLEVPKPETISGPDHSRIDFKVEATEVDGAPAVAVQMIFDVPTILGSDRYRAWQIYQAALARLGESRCVVTMPATAGGGTLE
jgi:hypothetical protein